jgi:hypothetical protein
LLRWWPIRCDITQCLLGASGQVCSEFRIPWRNGTTRTTHVVPVPLDFIARLAARAPATVDLRASPEHRHLASVDMRISSGCDH